MKLAHRKNFAEIRKIKYPKSRFDMSHSHAGCYDWGYLFPIMYEECSPGDHWNIGVTCTAKMMPTIAPIQHEQNIFVHTYFVPYRLLDENWETFITRGPEGTDDSSLPLWHPTADDLQVGSMWDHFALPLTACTGAEPIAYLKRAYNFVWNEYYRDENLQEEVELDNNFLLKRAWEKDYYTASLPFQQRGISPALPITGITSALWNSEVQVRWKVDNVQYRVQGSKINANAFGTIGTPTTDTGVDADFMVSADQLNANEVDLSTASTFDIADLRAAIQLQRWMERNARAGVRYTEFLEAHFNESPSDERLQRPEYIGGYRQAVTITEVLQVSESSTTPQGNRAGIGSTYGGNQIGHYHCEEYGIIMSFMSIMPRSMYTQGVNRQWLRRTPYDFLFPEFANLSEQAILTAEIFASGDEAVNLETFGYQGRYDELRQRTSRAVGLMRQSVNGLIHWNLSRKFATAPALNAEFIDVETQELKNRVFAIPTEPGFIITFGNILTVDRALPMIAEPGLMDHV